MLGRQRRKVARNPRDRKIYARQANTYCLSPVSHTTGLFLGILMCFLSFDLQGNSLVESLLYLLRYMNVEKPKGTQNVSVSQ